MKFYKCSKSVLKWKEMPQISFKWNLPILVDSDLNVIAGNSLKDCLPDTIIIVKMDNNQREVLFQALFDIETKIAEENSEERMNLLYIRMRDFFIEVRKPAYETYELFTITENRCITPELYNEPPPYDFNKHGKHIDANDSYILFEEFIEKNETESDIEIDMEILKELL